MNHDYVIIESIVQKISEVHSRNNDCKITLILMLEPSWNPCLLHFDPNLNRSEQYTPLSCPARGNFPAVAAASGPAFNASKWPDRGWEPAKTYGAYFQRRQCPDSSGSFARFARFCQSNLLISFDASMSSHKIGTMSTAEKVV
jgi:hypothetical protein